MDANGKECDWIKGVTRYGLCSYNRKVTDWVLSCFCALGHVWVGAIQDGDLNEQERMRYTSCREGEEVDAQS